MNANCLVYVDFARYNCCTVPLSNFQKWVDDIAERYLPGCRVTDGEGRFLIGHYKQMKGMEADEFLGELTRQLEGWGMFCRSNNLSCGASTIGCIQFMVPQHQHKNAKLCESRTNLGKEVNYALDDLLLYSHLIVV